jgi:hypothetical protein
MLYPAISNTTRCKETEMIFAQDILAIEKLRHDLLLKAEHHRLVQEALDQNYTPQKGLCWSSLRSKLVALFSKSGRQLQDPT